MDFLQLPKQALKILLRDPALLVLAFLPGIVALLGSCGVLLLLWKLWLHDISPWLAYPILIFASPVLWIVFGNLAILPVEDTIIDTVQKNVLGKIAIPAPKFSARRIAQELQQTIFISVFFSLLLLFSLLPGIAIFSSVAAAWVTAWNFLAAIYSRRYTNRGEKLGHFFRYIVGNTALGIFLNALLFVPLVNVWLLGYSLILATLVELQRLR